MTVQREMIRDQQYAPYALNRIRRLLEGDNWPKSGYEVIVRLARRTNPQNAYYHGVVVPMVADHLTEQHGFPFTSDMAHDLLKSQFLPASFHRTCPVTGRVFYGSTTDLVRSGDSDESWGHYIRSIQAWAAKSGLQIPEPNEGQYDS